ncbi:hypothetical protein D3C87_1927710 [compost metagenome]
MIVRPGLVPVGSKAAPSEFCPPLRAAPSSRAWRLPVSITSTSMATCLSRRSSWGMTSSAIARVSAEPRTITELLRLSGTATESLASTWTVWLWSLR